MVVKNKWLRVDSILDFGFRIWDLKEDDLNNTDITKGSGPLFSGYWLLGSGIPIFCFFEIRNPRSKIQNGKAFESDMIYTCILNLLALHKF